MTMCKGTELNSWATTEVNIHLAT